MRDSLGSKVRAGVAWSLLARGLDRAIAFAKAPILARLLCPHDFGLMGIVTTIVWYLDVITRTGFENALIQKSEIDEDHWDVGWSVSLLRSIVQMGVLFLLVKPVTVFYEEPALEPLLFVVAISSFLGQVRSIRVVQVFRQLDIGKVTRCRLVVTILATTVTLGLAVWLRNVWALVGGVFAQAVLSLIGSYIIAPYKPRFNLEIAKVKELWSFGKWMMVSGIFGALFLHADDLFVGKVVGIAALGYYSMAYKLGNMVVTELVDSLRWVFFPAFSSIQHDIPRLREAFFTTYRMTIVIGGAFCLGLFLLAPQFVNVLLGDRWLPIVPALRVLGLWGGIQMVTTSTIPLFRAVGRPDWETKIEGIQFAAMAVAIYPLTIRWGITGTAVSVLLAALLALPVALLWARKALVCRWWDMGAPLVMLLANMLTISAFYSFAGRLCPLSDFGHLVLFGGAVLLLYGVFFLILDRPFKMGLREVVRRIIVLRPQ